MIIRIPETDKKPGVCYAASHDGIELPVVDITHPTFSLQLGSTEIAALREQDDKEARSWARKPAFLRQILLFLVRRQSVMMCGLKDGEGSFLSGMNTYLMKLGAENLGKGYSQPFDRRIATRPPFLNVRFRLQTMAQLIADALIQDLEAGKPGPVRLVNIAGGPALDSLNALILIRKTHPRSLAGRSIVVQVLDQDSHGPTFGARALRALTSADSPLAGLDIAFEHLSYDWNHSSRLGEILDAFPESAIAAGSSEGGLFEYGSDEAILANLEMARDHSPANFTLTGSATLDLPHTNANIRIAKLKHRTFSPEGIRALSGKAGWSMERAVEGPTTICVRLRKR